MRVALSNFTGGEISSTLSARYDLSRYKNSVQCMENFVPNVHGTVERRPGTRFIAHLDSDAVLLPFSFSVDAWHNYVLIVSEGQVQVANADGIITTLTAPWALDDALTLSYAQVGDIVYLAHKNYALHKLTRSGSYPDYEWEIMTVVLNSSLDAPNAPTVIFTRTSDDEDDDVTYTLNYKVVAVDENGQESLPSEAGGVLGKHPSDWLVGNSATVIWSAVEGAEEYNIYREEAGYFGFIGITSADSTLQFIDNNYEADISDTPKEDWDPFADDNNPGVVSFYQQRMLLASTPYSPQAFYMSRVGDFESFRKSRPLQDDDPLEYHIASGNIDTITWVANFGDLLLGTSGSEYKVSGDGTAITPSNISITPQSYWGSSSLCPIIIGNSIMHVQRHGSRVRDLFYSLEKDGYAGNDLSIMAPHLFDGYSLRQWAYQQTPGSNIWIVRNDGVLLALTYMKEHDIWGWSRHITDGAVRSIISVSGTDGDDIFMVVQREVGGVVQYFLERLADRWSESDGISAAFYVDAGISQEQEEAIDTVSGLEHLEGCAVAVLADGSPVEGCVVENGAISLPYAAKIVHVGLAYSSALSPMPLEGDLQTGTTLGKQRGYGQCTVRLQSSVGGKYGTDRETLFDFPFLPSVWGDAVEPFSGDIDFVPGGGQGTDTSLWLMQDKPLPFSVGAVVINLDVAQM